MMRGAGIIASAGATLFNFKGASQFPQYRAGLARVAGGTGRCRVLGLGSSTMRGWGTGIDGNYQKDARRHGWFFKLAGLHAARGIAATSEGFFGGGNGSGISGGNEAAITLNLWTTNDSSISSIGGRPFIRTTNNSQMVFTPGNSWDTVEVYYQNDTGLGSFQLKIGAGAFGSGISTAGASALNKTTLASGAAAAVQTLTVNKSAGTGMVRIQGFLPYDATIPAVDFIPAGYPSTSMNDLLTNQSIGWGVKLSIPVVNPDLIVLQYSGTEFSNGEDPNLVYSRCISVIDMIRSVSSADIMLVTLNPSKESSYNYRDWDSYVAPLRRAALEKDVPLLNTIPIFGGRWTGGTRALMYDNVHALEPAHVLIAEAMDSALAMAAL